jgi:hypothetical protein
MDKSGYDFRIQRAEIDKEDIKYFKQWKHCRPMLFKVRYEIMFFLLPIVGSCRK